MSNKTSIRISTKGMSEFEKHLLKTDYELWLLAKVLKIKL